MRPGEVEGAGSLGTPESVVRKAVEGGIPGALAAHRVEKPWGYELIWAHTEEYVGKLLLVRPGEALSLQFHEEKDETLFLLTGELHLELGTGLNTMESVELRAGQSIRLLPGTLHRMTARTECTILEASTPELDDVVRIRDRYGRAPSDGVASP